MVDRAQQHTLDRIADLEARERGVVRGYNAAGLRRRRGDLDPRRPPRDRVKTTSNFRRDSALNPESSTTVTYSHLKRGAYARGNRTAPRLAGRRGTARPAPTAAPAVGIAIRFEPCKNPYSPAGPARESGRRDSTGLRSCWSRSITASACSRPFVPLAASAALRAARRSHANINRSTAFASRSAFFTTSPSPAIASAIASAHPAG